EEWRLGSDHRTWRSIALLQPWSSLCGIRSLAPVCECIQPHAPRVQQFLHRVWSTLSPVREWFHRSFFSAAAPLIAVYRFAPTLVLPIGSGKLTGEWKAHAH